MNITKRDRDILSMLNLKARESDTGIAKQLKISKQAVGHRIRRMQELGIIKNFYTEFNVSRLGFNSYYVFLELENINNRAEKEIIARLAREENIGWLINGAGKQNIILQVYARTLHEFDELYLNIKKICTPHLRDASFAILTKSQKLSYRFLNIEFEGLRTENAQEILLDKKDRELMKAIAQNAREKITSIAAKTKLSVDVVRYRLKRLQENNLIKGFRLKLDVSRLGYQWYLLLVRIQPIDVKLRQKFISYLLGQKEIYYITSTIGTYDFLIDLHVMDSSDVSNFIFKLRDMFPEVVKNFESLLVFKEYKISYLPAL